MKYSSIALLATTIGTVLAAEVYNVKLYVEYLPQNVNQDGYEPVNGKFLQAVKIDPTTYLFVLGDADEAATIQFDHSSDLAYIQDDQGTYFLGNDDSLNLVATSNFSEEAFMYETNSRHDVFNFFQVNSEYSYIPTKNVGDAIGYTKDHYALVADDDITPHGALIHYEVVGTNTGDGVGILNPNNITESIAELTTYTISSDFDTEVSTTDPPTIDATSPSSIDIVYGAGILGDNFSNDETDLETSASTTDSADSESGSASVKGSTHAPKTTSGGGASASDSSSGSAGGKPSSSGGEPSSSGSSAPSSSASSSTNEGHSKLVAGGVGMVALFAALL